AVAILALVVVGGSGAAWWWQERTAADRDVQAALTEVATHREAGRWPEARAALERAEGRLGTWGLTDLRGRLQQARLDSDLVADLDKVRLAQSERLDVKGPHELASNARYTAAFEKYGIELESQTPGEAAAALARSSVREELLAGLYDWLRI